MITLIYSTAAPLCAFPLVSLLGCRASSVTLEYNYCIGSVPMCCKVKGRQLSCHRLPITRKQDLKPGFSGGHRTCRCSSGDQGEPPVFCLLGGSFASGKLSERTVCGCRPLGTAAHSNASPPSRSYIRSAKDIQKAISGGALEVGDAGGRRARQRQLEACRVERASYSLQAQPRSAVATLLC